MQLLLLILEDPTALADLDHDHHVQTDAPPTMLSTLGFAENHILQEIIRAHMVQRTIRALVRRTQCTGPISWSSTSAGPTTRRALFGTQAGHVFEATTGDDITMDMRQ